MFHRSTTRFFFFARVNYTSCSSSLQTADPINILLQKDAKPKSIFHCKQLHAKLIVSNSTSQIHIINSLLSLYSKLNDLQSAHKLFDQAPQPNVVTYTSLISSYIHNGIMDKSSNLFLEMLKADIRPNNYTFSVIIRGCADAFLVELGLQIHGLINKFGLEKDEYSGSALVGFYFKVNGGLDDAFRVFDGLWRRDRVIYNMMISGFARIGDVSEVLRLFYQMRVVEELMPNDFTFTSLLKCCRLVTEVEEIHGLSLKFGLDDDVVVGSALVDSYGKWGDMSVGAKVFDLMEVKDGFGWSAIISNYVRKGEGEEAILSFMDMCRHGAKPDQHVLSSALKACMEIGEFETGVQVHAHMIKNGCQSDCFGGSALVKLYSDANDIHQVEKLFRRIEDKDIGAWNSIIMCYAQMEEGAASFCISLFRELCQTTMLKPDRATLVALLKSCQSVSDLAVGIQIHGMIKKLSESAELPIGNAVINMYSNCGAIGNAYKAFDDMVDKDDVSWSSMIGSYLQNGLELEAAMCSKEMLANGVHFTSFSLPLCIAASAKLAAIDLGKQLNSFIYKLGFGRSAYVGCAIIDMYAKCGSMEDSQKAFEEQKPNSVSFNALISGFAQNGEARKAIRVFREMENMRVSPNNITFSAVLSACGHAGLIEESLLLFDLMCRRYNFKPEPEHYACLIDVLGRAGRLEEAFQIVESDGSLLAWKALLSACKNYENAKVAEKCGRKVMQLDPNDPSPYILLSNLYSGEGRWEESSKLRQKMLDIGAKKNLGSSWLT